MRAAFPGESARYLEQYRRDCVTLGREVRLMGPEEIGRASCMERV